VHDYEKGAVMRYFTVRLKSVNDVKDFVGIVNNFDYDVDLISGRYIVDAKSIMGIFSLDLLNPIRAEFDEKEAEHHVSRLLPYVVPE
jgi:phosphocarrier protein HPr